MPAPSVDDIISAILEREGGFSDRPNDRGGPTNRGITLKTLSRWLKRPATIPELQALTEPEARKIYYSLYVAEPGFLKIRQPELRAQLVDFGVNSGPARAIMELQRVLRVDSDGILGAMTLSILERSHWLNVNNKLLCARVRFLGHLIERDRRQAENANGWMIRATDFLLLAQ